MVNRGICGETTGEMRDRFQADVLAQSPSHAIIMGGSNDAFMDVMDDDVQENISEMAGQARMNGIVPVIGLPPPCTYPAEEAVLEGYRCWMRRFSEQQKIPTVDFYSAFIETGTGRIKEEYLPDGVHPSEEGYLLMASVAVRRFRELLETGK
jgi:lysophospholipase L1-like esterase